jgi:hypothetical protein
LISFLVLSDFLGDFLIGSPSWNGFIFVARETNLGEMLEASVPLGCLNTLLFL